MSKSSKGNFSDDEVVDAVVEYRCTNKSQREIAREYGVPQSTFGYWHRGSARAYLQDEIDARVEAA
jgi:transposase-like protein